MPNKEGTTVLTGPPLVMLINRSITQNQTKLYSSITSDSIGQPFKFPHFWIFAPKRTPFPFQGGKKKDENEENYLHVACFQKLRLDLKNKTIL